VLPELDGTTVSLREDAIAGNPIVLVFCPKSAPSVAQALSEFSARHDAFAAAGARLFAVMPERARDAVALEIPFAILLDRKQGVFHAFGATPENTTAIVPRPNHHVIAILNGAARSLALDALEVVETLAAVRKPRTNADASARPDRARCLGSGRLPAAHHNLRYARQSFGPTWPRSRPFGGIGIQNARSGAFTPGSHRPRHL
jgi:peroxiredoxin